MTNKVTNYRNEISNLENKMLQSHDKIELQVKHHFAQGVYARELFIPAGSTLAGKIHKYECINIISQGKITVATEEGSKIVQAPCVLISPAGTKRAGYAHTDTIWITLHHTKETDPGKVEVEVIAKNFIEIDNLRTSLGC